jgi:flagellar biosynthesis/type III secretory pathway protein FliH
MINLTRTIEQSWRTLIEQTARVEGQVQELARISADIPLDAEMGDLALQMLERVLRGEFAGYDAWECDNEGNYRRDLGDVVLVYQPGSHQLLIEARLTELISAEARGTAEANGFTVGEVAVEAVGHYYSDGWGGRTEARARTEAETQAEQKLAEAIEELHRQQHAAELQAAAAQARAQAEQEAAIALGGAREAMRAAMRKRLQVLLANAEDRIYHTMNRLVAEAYRQSLIQVVHENGGRVLTDERTGSVMNLELEIF